MSPVEIAASRKTVRPRGYISAYRPQAKTRALLEAVSRVLEEYADHLPLTIRQVFYRLVGAYAYPKDENFYNKLCHHLANARRGGEVPFDAIRDDGVTTVRLDHFRDEDEFLFSIRRRAEQYRRNRLARQRRHLEVWCEAAGMIHQLARVAHPYSISVFSSSGFDSLSTKKLLAERICDIGKPATILHLGDCDPSGDGIFRAAAEDVAAFVEADRVHGLVKVKFERVALTDKQVLAYSLPTAPPKASDSRTKGWAGETCQLEALAPDQIALLLRTAIEDHLDAAVFEEDVAIERIERRNLNRLLLSGPGHV